MTTGERIDKSMRANGFNYNSLAKSVGIHASTIKNWITNKTNPDDLRLDKVCELLQVSKSWILTGIDDDSEPFHDIFKDVTKPTKNEQIINMERYIKNLEGQISYLHGRIEFYTSELSKKDHIIETLMKTNCAGCFEGKKGSAI